MKKYITFIFILAIFSIAHNASADTYEHFCGNGGKVTSNVRITPEGPFSTTPKQFYAEGYLASTCATRQVKMVVSHDGGPEVVLIPEVLLGPTAQFPIPSATKEFSSKTIAKKGYKVSFKTSVDETSPLLGSTNGWSEDMIACLNGGFTTAYNAEDYARIMCKGITNTTSTQRSCVFDGESIVFGPGGTQGPKLASARPYYTNYPTKTFPSEGDIISDQTNTLLNGKDHWWLMTYDTTKRYAVKINSVGKIENRRSVPAGTGYAFNCTSL